MIQTRTEIDSNMHKNLTYDKENIIFRNYIPESKGYN